MNKMLNKTKKKNLLDLAGAWSDSPEMDDIFKKIFEERNKINCRKGSNYKYL